MQEFYEGCLWYLGWEKITALEPGTRVWYFDHRMFGAIHCGVFEAVVVGTGYMGDSDRQGVVVWRPDLLDIAQKQAEKYPLYVDHKPLLPHTTVVSPKSIYETEAQAVAAKKQALSEWIERTEKDLARAKGAQETLEGAEPST